MCPSVYLVFFGRVHCTQYLVTFTPIFFLAYTIYVWGVNKIALWANDLVELPLFSFLFFIMLPNLLRV
jgi:hypothetical protein